MLSYDYISLFLKANDITLLILYTLLYVSKLIMLDLTKEKN